MPVSANTLFHFTEKDKLKGILQNQFHPKYHPEDLSYATPHKSRYKEAYIPMVCFCDLLFSQIKDHIDFYGDYGIGLRKDGWAIQWGLSPIIYLPETAISSFNFKSIAKEIGSKIKKSYERRVIRKQLQNLYKYIKPYQGTAFNKQKKCNVSKTFYDEREWRFVPTKFPVLSKKRVNNIKIENENEKLQTPEGRLGFKAEDIKYIIVKDEQEIPEFVDFIEKELKKQFKPRERKILVSKLISVTQIKDDM